MKRFILTVILFLLPVVLFYGILELGIRHIPNDYSYKNAWLEKNISSLEVLILGSSHSYYGLNPEYIDKKAFNAAHVSQSLKYDAFILEKFIDMADSLKYVILPISYFSLFSELEDGEEWWRVKKYCIYYDCPYHKYDTKYCMEITDVDTYRQILLLKKYYLQYEYLINVSSLGFVYFPKSQRRFSGWYNEGKSRALSHTREMNDTTMCTIRNNKAHIVKIIQLCVQKDVKVLLLTTPTCSTYYDNLDYSQNKIILDFCDSISHEYDNVRYINLMKDNRFDEDDFFDSDHLCGTGAEKLSKLVSKELW